MPSYCLFCWSVLLLLGVLTRLKDTIAVVFMSIYILTKKAILKPLVYPYCLCHYESALLLFRKVRADMIR